MILRTLFAALLFTGAAHAADFDRDLPVTGPADVFVSTHSGRIQIVPSDGNSIRVRAHVYAGWHPGSDIDERIRQVSEHPPIQQTGNAIHIGESSADRALYEHIAIDYQISAPRNSALYLHSGSGDIDVDNVGRSLKADTGSGHVRAHNLIGPADLQSGSGDIELQEQASGDVKAVTGSGSIRVTGIAGAFQAASGSGDIEVGGQITGPSHLRTGSGSIRLHLGREGRITLDAATGSGSIQVPGMGSGRSRHVDSAINGGGPKVDAHTGSGDIEVN